LEAVTLLTFKVAVAMFLASFQPYNSLS